MREILEMADNDILVTNDQGNVLFANASLLEIHPEIQNCLLEKNIGDLYVVDENKEVDIMSFVKERVNKECIFYNKKTLEPLRGRVALSMWEKEKAYFYFFKREGIAEDERSRAVLDQLPYAVWREDINGRFCYANKIFKKCLTENMGYEKAKSVTGKMGNELWDQSMCEVVEREKQEVLRTKKTRTFEAEFELKGKKRDYRFKLAPILDNEGNIKFICGICEENTYLKCIQVAMEEGSSVNSKYLSEEVKVDAVDEIIEDIRARLHADGLYIGIVKHDTLYISNTAGIATEEFKDKMVRKGAKEWAEYVSKNWGLIEAKDIRQFMSESDREEFPTQFKYYFYHPIKLGNDLISFLTAYYIDEKPDLSEAMLWLPRLCAHIALLMKNKIVVSSLGNNVDQLRTRASELDSIVHTATDLTVFMNRDGTISKVNFCWEKELGWKQEEMIGKKLRQFFYIEDRVKMISEAKACYHEKKSGFVRLLCNDARLQWYGWQMKYEPHMDQIIFAAVNITEQLEAVRVAEQEKDTKEIENFRDGFLINVSHEFRTPVNVILSAIQLLRIMQEQTGELQIDEFEKYSDKIKQNSYRLLRLTNNLIALSQSDIHDAELHFVNTNIITLIENIIEGVRNCIDSQKVEIKFVANTSVKMLACDISKIEKVVLNLISNSIKYAKLGEKAVIKVSVMSNDSEVCIGVKDNGIGLSKEKRAIIFEPFVQGNAILNRPAEGCGIGLTLVKRYTELHHGKVQIESEEGVGTEFTIHLPITTTDQREEKQGNYRNVMEQCHIELSDIPC